MTENIESRNVDRTTEAAAGSGAARGVTTRRRLMLGAAAVIPSVVTLRSGAQVAAASFNCISGGGKTPAAMLNSMGVPRFTPVKDDWLRKQVYSGQAVRAGATAYCTTWDQQSILAVATLQKTGNGMGYKANAGTTWSTGDDVIKIGAVCPPWESSKGAGLGSYCYAESIENISPQPEYWALVYVDETGMNVSLEPGPGLAPVRATCWASLAASRGTNLG